jgi:hypothetical protein
MFYVYGTKGGRSIDGRRVLLHLHVISTNRVLVFVSTTCVARAGRGQVEDLFEKQSRALLLTACFSQMPFEWWNNVICSASKYHL